MKSNVLLLTVICLICPFASLIQGEAAVLGDVNNDGKIGLEESVYALRATSGISGEYTASVVVSWKGGWEANHLYINGDAVYLDGTSYICIADHLSDALNTPPFAETWNIMARKGDTAAFAIGSGLLLEGETLSVRTGTGLAITGTGIGLEPAYADGSAYDARFVSKLNDAMNLLPLDQTPCPCDTSHTGTIYLTPVWRLCVCNGNQWVEVNDGSTPCSAQDIDNDGDGFSESSGDCDDSDNQRYPGAIERCDGEDNNCDGRIDEDFPQLGDACGDGGMYVCEPEGGVICSAPEEQPQEICDGIDNDFDGQTDEGLGGQPCGAGACAGVTVCDGAEGVVCLTDNSSSDEVCDGIDNDCDGQTDEGFNTGEPCGAGVCSGGVIVCNPAGGAECSTDDLSYPEACDAIDNDCDGQTDEGIVCN